MAIKDWHSINFDFSDDELECQLLELGRAIFVFSTLEIQVAHALSAALGISHLGHGEALAATIDAINKQKLLDGFASLFKAPPNGDDHLGPDFELSDRFKQLARLFQDLLTQRNILAHGTFAKYGDRILVGSMQLSARLRADGGSGKWIWMDELPDYHRRCADALSRASGLKADFQAAYSRDTA